MLKYFNIPSCCHLPSPVRINRCKHFPDTTHPPEVKKMNTMSKLTLLFGYQRFEGNLDLQQAIDSVHRRYQARELSLDSLDMIAAAGVPDKSTLNRNGLK